VSIGTNEWRLTMKEMPKPTKKGKTLKGKKLERKVALIVRALTVRF
jgi:nitrogen fixation protein